VQPPRDFDRPVTVAPRVAGGDLTSLVIPLVGCTFAHQADRMAGLIVYKKKPRPWAGKAALTER